MYLLSGIIRKVVIGDANIVLTILNSTLKNNFRIVLMYIRLTFAIRRPKIIFNKIVYIKSYLNCTKLIIANTAAKEDISFPSNED